MSYSLLGITHTLSTPAPLRAIPELLYANIHSWDAIICTSKSAQSAIENIWKHGESIWRMRGGKPAQRPQLPLIPLGIDTTSFKPISSRKDARQRLNISNKAAVVLWTGRLELHCKAHHGATFRAIAKAAQACPHKKWVLLMYGTSVMQTVPEALQQAASELCPNVEVRLLDGHNLELGALARAASDMAISLVDSLQETFGLTPVEAMASGLPVVVSDWNGYRDTIQDGKTGHLIRSHSFEPGWNDLGLLQRALDESCLDQVSARISGQIGIDTELAGAALAHLASSPETAVAMGALGQQRARTTYDWSVILNQYNELLDELAERRQHASSDPKLKDLAAKQPLPALSQVFKSWPSEEINSRTLLKAKGNSEILRKYLGLKMINLYRKEMPPSQTILDAYNQLNISGSTNLEELKTIKNPQWKVSDQINIAEAIGWLLKHGFAEACT